MTEKLSQLKFCSVAKLRKMYLGDEEAIIETAQTLLQQLPEDLAKLEKATKLSDVRRIAHKLKNSSKLFEIDAATVAINRLEKCADYEPYDEHRQDLIESLKAAKAELELAIRQR